ncbi:PD-(D/E)XK nuclease-like domain-containing protein [Pseudoalteromonas sp. SR45-4]|uniref:PD-(D/E)XK nuclease-like domain-containing protein n=1 Tax=Pseudoalteromonas sp. SR45-4 TaxID=2760929 RepID=UPI0015FB9B24|nr:PD-(D/E)XK nuclease-like domain-containing protein [Pseudoalteromonas sp. SR45-4]MBB1371235.1 PD-(D/E)XK nuclease-like domain-containing protein [Pseudoalteromonas sp. SR45-4]
MIGTGLFISDNAFDAGYLDIIDDYLKQEAKSVASISTNQRLYLSDYDIEIASLNENLPFNVTPAYDSNGKPNFIDASGCLVAGIYSGMENEVYHSLDAISSSKVKKYAKSPAHYKRAYVDKIDRKRISKQTERTFDAGTYAHELVLEPEGFYNRYFKLLNQVDYPNTLNSLDDLRDKCKEHGLPVSGTKAVLIERLITADPAIEIFEEMQKQHIIANAGQSAVDKAYEVIAASSSRTNLIDTLKHDEVKPLLLKTAIDPVVWDDAHRACETMRNHDFANAILQDGFAELSVIAECPETGMMLKVRFDWLTRDGIPADVKTTRSANPTMASYQFADLGYDLQAYMYTYVGRLAGIPCPENVFPFVTCEYIEADICEVLELSDEDWEIAGRNFHKHIKNLKQSIDTDQWSGYTSNSSSILYLPKRGRA